jgi:diadenosine tetraphosphate (Ap4A) HIT family hydrolase
MDKMNNYQVRKGHTILHNGKRYSDIIQLTEAEALRLKSKVVLVPSITEKPTEKLPETLMNDTIEELSITEEITEKKSKKGVKE